MKKFLTIVSALILCLACVGAIPTSPANHRASGEEETYLISPTALAVTSSTIYVADSFTGKIMSYDKSTKGLTATTLVSGVKKLLLSGENLFALTITDQNSHGLQKLDFGFKNTSTIDFPSAYPDKDILDITISGSTVYVLRSGGNIDHMNLVGNTLTMRSPSTTSTSTLNLLNMVYNDLNSINERSGKLVLTTPTCAYELNLTNSAVREIFKVSSGDIISHASATHLTTTSGKLVDIDSKTFIQTNLSSCSGLYCTSDIVYLSSDFVHKVYKVEKNQISDLSLNPPVIPNRLVASDLIHIKLINSTPLFLEPYSVHPCLTVQGGTHLTVIGTYKDFYFCMVVGDTNQYLYLNKNSANFETINTGSANTKFTATRTNKIYSLPSTKTDEANKILGTIQASEDIMVKNSTIIENSNGELFYLVEHENGHGFVRTTFFQSTKGTVELTTPCNAKTKRATTLFENANASGVILTLEKGTRIALKEEVAPTKDYILVEYQDTNGVVYTGYLLSDDVDPDGLSTLQILGLVLVGTNLILLLTIFLIKRRSKKWKV